MTEPILRIDTNSDVVAAAFREVGSKRLMAWVAFSLREEAHDFIPFVQQNYLSGQKLKRRTGQTSDSVKTWMPGSKKLKVYSDITARVRPGVGITGSLNYLGRWTGTEREFMRPAFAAFAAGNRVERAIDDNIDKMLRKVFNEKQN